MTIEPKTIERIAWKFQLGRVKQVSAVGRGSIDHPKLVLQTERGVYFLKHRRGRSADPRRCAEIHRVHDALRASEFPVPGLVRTPDGRHTIVRDDAGMYELMFFVNGLPYNQMPQAARSAGAVLAAFHHQVASLHPPRAGDRLASSYHDAGRRMHELAERIMRVMPTHSPDLSMNDLKRDVQHILTRYRVAADRVNQHGFHRWPRMIVHGDWHPGNLVFRDNLEVAAVLDLDSLRFEPRITDIANGALHFSLQTLGPTPASWPEGLDDVRLVAFCDGYDHYDPQFMLSRPEVQVFPYLMIEALIAESLAPIASTGEFNNIPGLIFLQMIERKSRWIEANASRIINILNS